MQAAVLVAKGPSRYFAALQRNVRYMIYSERPRRDKFSVCSTLLCFGNLMFWPIRHKTPVGSTSTKSRKPQGRSSGGSGSYLLAMPLGLDVAPPRVDVLDQQMHHEVGGVNFVVEIL